MRAVQPTPTNHVSNTSSASGNSSRRRFNKIGWQELDKPRLLLYIPFGSVFMRTLAYVRECLRCLAAHPRLETVSMT